MDVSRSRSKSKRSAPAEPVQRKKSCRSKVARLQQQARDEEDKENVFRPLCGSTPHSNKMSKPGSTPLIKSDLKGLSWSLKKVLTPIKEEKLDQSMNIRCLPKNFLTPKATGLLRRGSSKSKEKSSKVKKLEEYFITPERLNGGYVSLAISDEYPDLDEFSMDFDMSEKKSSNSEHPVGRMTSNSRMNETTNNECLSVEQNITQSNPVCDLTSNDPMFLKDISQISQVSSLHEQASSANLSGAFHSTFQYPLHSTFNYPLHSSFNFSTIAPPATQSGTPGQKCPLDVRKYILKKQNATPARKTVQFGSQSFKSPERPCSCLSQSDSTFSSDEDCTEIDVDDYSQCDSSYLSDFIEEDPSMDWSSEVRSHRGSRHEGDCSRSLRRQAGHAELSSAHISSSYRLRTGQALEMSGTSDLSMALGTSQDDFSYSSYSLGASEKSSVDSLPRYCNSRSLLNKDMSSRKLLQEMNINDTHYSRKLISKVESNHRGHFSKSLPAYSKRSTRSVKHNPSSSVVSSSRGSSVTSGSITSSCHHRSRSESRSQHSSLDSGCSMNSSHSKASCKYTISDNTGRRRTIFHNASASATMNLERDRKRSLSRRFHRFTKSFNQPSPSKFCTETSHIKTLGHF